MTVLTSARTDMPMASPRMGGALTLSVLGGLHQGVDARIEGDSCTIGSASQCDVVLADGHVAPDHLRLRFHGRQVAVDAVGGDVDVIGHALVPRGHGCRVPLPVTLTLGQARIQIHRSQATTPPMMRWLSIGGAGVLVLVTAIMFATQSNGFGSANVTRIATPSPVSTVAAPQAEGTQALAQLHDRFAQNGLTGLIATESDRHIEVSGTITTDQLDLWNQTQRWFDGAHGGQYVLTSHVTPAIAAAPPAFSFQAVWFGENPYLIDAKGERRYPGAALQDGWMLKSIAVDGITVTRNGTDFQLTL